jgi:Fe-S-cluster containining protein
LHEIARKRSKNAAAADQFCDRSNNFGIDVNREAGSRKLEAIRCLSIHAPYVCAHAGECCRAGWTIPVEEHLVAPLNLLGIRIDPNRVAPSRPTGECVFFEADAGRLCTIHRCGGPALLPSVCRHFPRVIVKDPRGTSVTLSHFCPTAAGLLFAHAPLSIVEAPPALSLGGGLEGLDATNVLPPLLSKDVLMDWDGYTAWEEAAIALFDVDGAAPEQAVETLLEVTDRVSSWKPGQESLSSMVRREFAAAMNAAPRRDGRWGGYARPIKAFLAAHAFASWAAYESDGLRSVAAAVESALRQLTEAIDERDTLITRTSLVDALRTTDLKLRHAPA